MSRIEILAEAIKQGKIQADQLLGADSCEEAGTAAFAVDEIYDLAQKEEAEASVDGDDGIQLQFSDLVIRGQQEYLRHSEEDVEHRIAAGDNLDYMVWLLKEKDMAGKLQLIYVDPPFFSNAKYQASVQIKDAEGNLSPVLKVGAYEDKWEHDFGAYLEMLAVRFYLMRELLSETGCLWVHLDWHGAHYVKMMLDEIFGHERFINEVAWTYKSGGASKRSFARKHDTLLFYSKTKTYKFNPQKEKSYNREGKPYRFKGVEEFQDEHGWYTMVNMKDVWNIDMVGRTSSERMGYATQKPEKLLERIVISCSDEGDLCADFFAGTGTLAAVCSRTNRRWILCDEGDAAISEEILRMSAFPEVFVVERPVITDYKVMPRPSAEISLEKGRIKLKRYQPDLTRVREEDREIISGYINEGGLDLISFWSVDPAYDGRVHVTRKIIKDGERRYRLPGWDPDQADKSKGISAIGYDLFGGRFSWEDNK